MFTTARNEGVKAGAKPMQFGKLSLNRDTLCQMGAELPGLQGTTDIQGCPGTTTITKVTAHCC